MIEYILLILLGSTVGLSSALVGLGGNILIVPTLPLFTTLPLKSIVATGILTVFFVTFFNATRFYKQKLIDLKLITLLFIPTSFFSFLSSYYSDLVSEPTVMILFLTVMIGMLIKLFIPKKIGNTSKNYKVPLIFAGTFSGALAGLTGVGTGIILAPLLLSMSVTDEKKVSPTINCLIMISCLFSSFNYISITDFQWPNSGSVRLDYVIFIAIPAIISSAVGRKLNSEISPKKRKILVATILVALIIKTLS